MIYLLAVFLPPLALLLNGQPFSAILNLLMIVPCFVFGLVFHVLLLVPSAHAVIAIHLNRRAGCLDQPWIPQHFLGLRSS